MAEPQPIIYENRTSDQVRALLRNLGAQEVSKGSYNARGGVKVKVTGSETNGFKVKVIPLGCAC